MKMSAIKGYTYPSTNCLNHKAQAPKFTDTICILDQLLSNWCAWIWVFKKSFCGYISWHNL